LPHSPEQSQLKALDDLLETSLAKVKESQAQHNTTVISALDESQRSKSVLLLPSE
jgi:DNA-binding transcriptional regulator YbjK